MTAKHTHVENVSTTHCPTCDQVMRASDYLERVEADRDRLRAVNAKQEAAIETLRKAKAATIEDAVRLAKINAELAADATKMALRLIGEPDETFSPDVWDVMRRWRPACEAMLNGDYIDVARAALENAKPTQP